MDASSAHRRWWDSDAARYHDDHKHYLRSFYWCPEMLHEADAQLLGELSNSSVLEIGCGSAPCTAWLQSRAHFATGFDISRSMLEHAKEGLPLTQVDALDLPYFNSAFDVVFSAFGAFPFIPDITKAFTEVARVLREGGRFVFSVNHPMRWVFPDDPGVKGLIAGISYFEDHYAEYDDNGDLEYIEYHRSVGDWIRALNATGFRVLDILEPQWPQDLEETWGQWSPLRGKIFPGTAIFVARLEP